MYTDPQAYYYYYQQYYAKYYEQQRNQYREHQRHYYPSSESLIDDRGRSGRSSVTDDLQKAPSIASNFYGDYNNPPSLEPQDQVDHYYSMRGGHPRRSRRDTPPLFKDAHISASFSPGGNLNTVLPFNPETSETSSLKSGDDLDSTRPIVQLRDVNKLFNEDKQMNDRIKHFQSYPGPLTRTDTHKDVVIKLCERRAADAAHNQSIIDNESVSLLWEYLGLLVKQNGKVCGIDLSSILLKEFVKVKQEDNDLVIAPGIEHQSQNVENLATEEIPPLENTSSIQEELIERLNTLLCQGRTKEAVDFAVKNRLWGYAMTIASKMDAIMQMKVMNAFMQSIPKYDIFQTWFHHLSGKRPDVTKAYCPSKWGSWRPHLSMLVSNKSSQPQKDAASIISFGDTLLNRGQLHAAHLCYLLGNAEWGSYMDRDGKLVLLGVSNKQEFMTFISEESIQLTEVYEYAQSLDTTNSSLAMFQPYKFIYAMRLAECGFQQEALRYCEVISEILNENIVLYKSPFVMQLVELSLQLKYYDIHYQLGQGELLEMPDPDWLQRLQNNLLLIQYREYEDQQGVIKEEPLSETNCSSPVISNTDASERHSSIGVHTDGNYYNDMLMNQRRFSYEKKQLNQLNSFDDDEMSIKNEIEINNPTMVADQHIQYSGNFDNEQNNKQELVPDVNMMNGNSMNEQYDLQNQQQFMHNQQFTQEQKYEDIPIPAPVSIPQRHEDPTQIPNNQQSPFQSNIHHQPQWKPSVLEPSMLHPSYMTPQSQPPIVNNEPQQYMQPPIQSNYPENIPSVSPPDSPPVSPPVSPKKSQSESKKFDNSSKGGNEDEKSSGFLGSLFGGWRGKNSQAKLPDDSNPTIVWDDENKRWVNKDGEDETETPPPPPPKLQGPPPNPAAFRGGFKKSRYVDPVGDKGRAKTNLPNMMAMPTLPAVPSAHSVSPSNNFQPQVNPAEREPMIDQGFSASQQGQNMSNPIVEQISPQGVPMMNPSGNPGPPMFFNPATFQQNGNRDGFYSNTQNH